MDKIRFQEPEMGDLMSKRFFRLGRFDTSNLRIAGKMAHPILGHFSKVWGELERADIAYRYAFTAPNGYGQQIEKIIQLFHAPITLFKFSVRGENVVVIAGELALTGLAQIQLDEYPLGDADIQTVLIDFLAVFGVARRFVNALMDSDFRLCHHKECPLFESNFCNTWTFIPRRYEECKFPDRIKRIKSRMGSKPATQVRMQLQVGTSRSAIEDKRGESDVGPV